MTGSVHFHVPCNDRTAQLQRPSLLRPVSMEEADNSVNEIHESLPRKAAVRLYRQISSGFNSRTIRCVLLISLSVNLTFAVLVGVLVGFWQFSKEQNQRRETVLGTMGMSSGRYMSAKPSDVYSCFPCAESDEISGIRVTVRSKNGFCCTTDIVPGYEQSNGLFQLTREYVRANCRPNQKQTEWGGMESADGQIGFASAAHLTLDVKLSKENLERPKFHFLTWRTHDEAGISFISDDLHYNNGSITIPSSGRYHVYTHLAFDTNGNRLSRSTLLVDHAIIRQSQKKETLQALDRVYLHRLEIKSSHLEGTFQLLKGDKVMVRVSFPKYLYNLPTNVFGLFRLLSD